MFGLLVQGTPIASFITNQATPLLYWGKKEITHQENTGTSDVIYPLFNFPGSWSVAFFVYSKTLDAGVYAVPVVDGGVWKIAVNWLHAAGAEFTVYAFVEARHIASPSWGMQVFNPAGQVVYHTGRPALSVKEIGSYTGTYKPASTGDGYQFRSTTMGSSSILNSIRFHGAYKKSDGSYAVGYLVERVVRNTGLYVRTFNSVVPIIDAGYYDQFSSLGNYPV